MKKLPVWLIILIIIAVLIAVKLMFFAKPDQTASGPSRSKTAGPVAVNYFVTYTTEFTNDIFTTGKIGAFNQIEIIPEVAGKVTAVHFREGELVAKGKLLVELNDADLQAQLLKTRTQLRLAEQKLERVKRLLEIKGISQEEFDMQENELMALKADEAFILAQVSKMNIVAPFEGVIGLRNISEGSFVNGNTPIASLVQMKPLYIEFSVPEKYDELLRKGSAIKFSSDEISAAETFTASVYAIEPQVDESTKTIRARALYSGKKVFYPGSFVKVYVDLGKTTNVLMIPTQAVIATLKGQKVIVSRKGKAVEVPVEIGVRTDEKIQILNGLQPGDTVITTGLLSVKANTDLKLIRAEK